MTDSKNSSAPPLKWQRVALNLGIAALAVGAWKLGAPDWLVGALGGASGVSALTNGWKR